MMERKDASLNKQKKILFNLSAVQPVSVRNLGHTKFGG